ncbi:MAG: hemerythrin domain-containing protein [Pseudomonadota bacterium]
MATRTPAKKASSTAAKKAPAKTAARRPKDACDLLDADHKAVKKMFEEFETLTQSRGRNAPAKKRELADRICMELTVHTTIEEEIFYPAVRGAIKDNALLNEATVEHASAKDLIAQIRGMDENDEMFDARVSVLGEYIDHHVKEERTEMFPKVRKTRLDLVGMREQLQARKDELMASSQLEEVSEMA